MANYNLFTHTPLIESLPLAKMAGRDVYLKLENTQPTASFKQRGISYRSLEILKEGYKEIVMASGGNAGLALAYCARKLGIKAHIVVPEATTAEMTKKLELQGAKVYICGKYWNEANKKALEIAEEIGAFYVHPFDHPTIWKGHATMISEVAKAIPSKPSAVVTCVGGGGLLCGVIEGLRDVGWNEVSVVAMETKGAESFHASVKAGKLITLPKITSIATTLGASRVCPKCMEYAEYYHIISEVVDDSEAISACIKFADDHKMLVEPSCGASLSAVYSGIVPKLIETGQIKGDGPILVIVCGGSDVDLKQIEKWKNMLNNA